ncbi:Hypothetical predicted protein [Paramuricea clavata]|uniref:Transposable element P transposase-like GTP-binding insertion domain-containing protein n=1 Tax=Paramuricea clavata TaxID=317549 RepID=A0A7D9H749_PARCT|nr:Hypothetical predicted protein [Paramuricea clavata]
MKVSFAVQVLSNTVAEALKRHYLSGEASETAKFCQMMNDFFDCMNVHSTSEHQRKRNPRLAPYQHIDDSRFDCLNNKFLQYLTSWKSSIDSRGPFSDDDKGRMFLSVQTFTGLKMMVFVERRIRVCAHRAFLPGVEEYDVEEYFGYQRAQGRRNDNPTAVAFGYNDLKIATLRDVAHHTPLKEMFLDDISGKRSKNKKPTKK